jgi:hypothetical protein
MVTWPEKTSPGFGLREAEVLQGQGKTIAEVAVPPRRGPR